MIENEDDFFNLLPEMPEKLGKRNFSFMSEQQIKDAKIMKMKDQVDRMNERLG